MKKRTKIILSVIGILFVGGITFAATHRSSGLTVVIETVKRGNIYQTVEVTGDTQSVQNIDLAFNTSGTIAVINKKIGDTVKAGNVLAVLSEAKIAASLSQAANAVNQAQAALDVKRAGATQEEIAVYIAGVSSAQAAVDAAQSGLNQTQLESSQTQNIGNVNVVTAETSLSQIESSTGEDLLHAQQDELESLRSLVSEVRNALSKADAVLGVENQLVNIDFDQDLGISDPNSFSNAVDSFIIAGKSRDVAEDMLALVSIDSISTLAAATSAAQTAYEDTYTTLLDTSKVLDATTGGSASLSMDDLSAMKTSISGATSALTADGSALNSTRQILETTTRSNANDVTNAENALTKAKATRDQNNASFTAQIASATSTLALRESDLVKAQAQLAQISAAPRSVDLAGLEAAVAITQAQYSAALANAADARIISPIDGIVTAVNGDIGEQATMGSTMITLLGAVDQFEIVMNIPEADIAKIHIGQTSTITFDAFGEDREFQGSVLSINPAEKLIEGVVFYESKVILNTGTDTTNVKSGMSANVTIHTREAQNALYIPKRAILEDAQGKYVRIPKGTDGTFDRRSVTAGLTGDDGSAEILSGLSEGETIIVTIR